MGVLSREEKTVKLQDKPKKKLLRKQNKRSIMIKIS